MSGNGVITQPKKSKPTDGSSILAAKFDTLTSSIHHLMQVMTPPALAESGPGEKGKAIDMTVKKVRYEESEDPEDSDEDSGSDTQVMVRTSHQTRWT